MKLACLICAYNEEARIGLVLDVVTSSSLFDQVVVVDDGSTDGTANVARRFASVSLVSLPTNRGKAEAMRRGLAEVRCEKVMLLDADLCNLTHGDLASLAHPVLSGEVDIAISLRKNALWIYRRLGLDFASGERVADRSLVADCLARAQVSGFGIEVAMNRLIVERRLRIAVVPMPGVSHTRKTAKLGWVRGIAAEWKMVRDVLRTISPFEVMTQNYRMLALSRAPERDCAQRPRPRHPMNRP